MQDDLLLDRYRILDALGEGATSTVVRAFDTRMERHVAIKIIPKSKHTAERALREARTVALLNHPNIVTVHEFDQADDNFYLIMEDVEGTTLADLLSKKAPLPQEVAIAIAIQVCEALENAHSNDIVHRDIKPANLMIMPDGRVRVMDFGISRLSWVPITRDGSIIGTAAYMSPEQSAGELVDERSDIFSLGVVLYEMLTGINPFDAVGAKAAIFKIRESNPSSPDRRNPGVSPEIGQVVMRALAKFPADRYDLATDFRYKLERHRQEVKSPRRILAEYLASSDTGVHSDGRPLTYLLERWHEVLSHRLLERLPGAVLAAGYWLWLSQGASWPGQTARLSITAAIAVSGYIWGPAGILLLFVAITGGFLAVSLPGALLSGSALAAIWYYAVRKNPQAGLLSVVGPLLQTVGAPFAAPLAIGGTTGPVAAAITATLSFGIGLVTTTLAAPGHAWPALGAPAESAFVGPFAILMYLGVWVLAASVVATLRNSSKLPRLAALPVGAMLMFWGYRTTPFLAGGEPAVLPLLLQWVTVSFIIGLAFTMIATLPSPGERRGKDVDGEA